MKPTIRWKQERLTGKELRMQSIIEAAEQVFTRKGFEKATMQDIAEEVNIGIATVFRYFPKKEKLIVAVASRSVSSRITIFQEIRNMPITGIEKLEKLFDYFISLPEKDRESTKLLEAFENFAAQSEEPLEDIKNYNDSLHEVSQIFFNIISDGEIDNSIRSDIPLRDTVSSITNMFAIFSKKLSLHQDIVMLESDVDPNRQLLITKKILIDYLKASPVT
ncbi:MULTISPECIES: TetR/AcrR family transcriptional regulator [unclassified Bacillus (in: firmicutes)]|uniref:TetR/AcrR family transcriptional regulator n=1 Tax=unclassified Bacillus (in: firmicutes) TaxID=185979 RepID=UPI001BE7307C|nr:MULTISPECIES: TetR/AcrR family transcriptional regulator [unclassified Bacillus (in: firmicutes)]MBT2617255.1 TetR/AcrR family transcriptional regulator [Bacillus sp. ISL-78]MBT2627810.1 TetR/AcrR family transcriptional regulator [Bacillus sp. ISL-101]